MPGIDIKELYMNGRHELLTTHASSLIREQVRKPFSNILRTILYHQYVASPADISSSEGVIRYRRLYRTVRGSGMGLTCSGEVASAAFYVESEKSYACCPIIQERFGVALFVRYADDILIVFSSASLLQRSSFFRELKARSRTYPLLCESVSSTSVAMLDLEIYVDGSRLRTKPYIKPTQQRRWLSDSSYHWASVHNAWPASYEARLANISSCHGDAIRAINSFRSSLAAQCPGHVGLLERSNSAPRSNLRYSWFVLPFSEHWAASGISSFLVSLTNAAVQAGLKPARLAWRLGGKHWTRVIQGFNQW